MTYTGPPLTGPQVSSAQAQHVANTASWIEAYADVLPDGWALLIHSTGTSTLSWGRDAGDGDVIAAALRKTFGNPDRIVGPYSEVGQTHAEWSAEGSRPALTVYWVTISPAVAL